MSATSPAITARPAAADDLGAVRALVSLAATEARPQRGGALLIDFDFGGVLDVDISADDAVATFVGVLDDTVVGYLVLRRHVTNGVTVAMVEQLFVHPETRSVGVGATLLNCAAERGRQRSAVRLESHVLPGNRAAKNFFERMGLVTRKMRVSAPIDDS